MRGESGAFHKLQESFCEDFWRNLPTKPVLLLNLRTSGTNLVFVSLKGSFPTVLRINWDSQVPQISFADNQVYFGDLRSGQLANSETSWWRVHCHCRHLFTISLLDQAPGLSKHVHSRVCENKKLVLKSSLEENPNLHKGLCFSSPFLWCHPLKLARAKCWEQRLSQLWLDKAFEANLVQEHLTIMRCANTCSSILILFPKTDQCQLKQVLKFLCKSSPACSCWE